MELTETEFWEKYWQGCPLPSEVNMDIGFDRCLAQALAKRLHGVSGDVFEVGCAPGKWLAFMAKTFQMRASGIEYSLAGTEATHRNLKLLGMPVESILAGDFFKAEPQPQYDVVMSFGFIEHFDDPDAVVQRHAQWLKPGGRLVIGVPNFNGVYRPLQRILNPDILEKHNLKIMHLDYFKNLGDKVALDVEHVEYLGSFEPSLPIANPGLGNPAQFLIKVLLRGIAWLRRSPRLDKINHPLFSSCILAIYRKPPLQ